jgi:phage virion morphogenesis protein
MAAAVEIIDQALKVRLAKMIAANNDSRPLMAGIAVTLLDSVEHTVESEGIPRWAALSKKTTIPRRIAAGQVPIRMLDAEGELMRRNSLNSGPNFAEVTNNYRSAKTMHYGAKKGQFGRSTRGGPLPWGDIPARPFMVLLPANKKKILDGALAWVSGDPTWTNRF